MELNYQSDNDVDLDIDLLSEEEQGQSQPIVQKKPTIKKLPKKQVHEPQDGTVSSRGSLDYLLAESDPKPDQTITIQKNDSFDMNEMKNELSQEEVKRSNSGKTKDGESNVRVRGAY